MVYGDLYWFGVFLGGEECLDSVVDDGKNDILLFDKGIGDVDEE